MADEADLKSMNDRWTTEANRWPGYALDNHRQFRADFLRTQKWTVVPVESALHFDDNDAELISNAADSMGADSVMVLLIEELSGVETNRVFDTTKKGLLNLNRVYSHFNVALLPREQSFSLICSTDDYFLVAGPAEFVELAVGSTLAEAYSRFDEFANDDFWSPRASSMLRSVSRRYKGSRQD